MRQFLPRAFIGFAVVLLITALWLVTRGNVVWRVHQHYPNADVDYYYVTSWEPAWSDLVRMFGIRFYSGSDSMAIHLADTAVDFNHFRGMTILEMHLTRCQIVDIRPLLTTYHPYVTFEDCDLTAVPADQLRFLEQLDQKPSVFYLGNFALIEGLPMTYPGVRPLNKYSLFP